MVTNEYVPKNDPGRSVDNIFTKYIYNESHIDSEAPHYPINELYNYFNNINPEEVERLQNSGYIFPWKIVESDRLNDVSESTLSVYLSDEFNQKYGIKSKDNAPPIFCFRKKNYTDSYTSLKHPISSVEINTISDSNFDGTVHYNKWELNIDNENQIEVKKPKQLFTSNNDIIHILRPFTKQPHTPEEVIENYLTANPVNSESYDRRSLLLQQLRNFPKGDTDPNDWLKAFVIQLDQTKPYIKTDEWVKLLDVKNNITNCFTYHEEQALKFVKATDMAFTRKSILNLSGIGFGLMLAKTLPKIQDYKENLESNSEYEEGKLKEEKDINYYCSKLEALNQPDLSLFYRSIFELSKRWNVKFTDFEDRFIAQLHELKTVIELIATEQLSPDILDTEPSQPKSAEEVVNNASIFIDSVELDLDPGRLKGILINCLNCMPHLKGTVEKLNSIYGVTSGSYFYSPYKNFAVLPDPSGSNWSRNPYFEVDTVLHELTHAWHWQGLHQISQTMKLRDYIKYINLEITLSSKLLDLWLDNYEEMVKNNEFLIGGWATNYNTNSYNIEYVESIIKLFPEYRYLGDNEDDYLLTAYNATYGQERRVNDFFHWAISKSRQIAQKRESLGILLPEDSEFIRLFRAFNLGDWAVSHMSHQLNSILPLDNNYELALDLEHLGNSQLQKIKAELFKFVCINIIKESPDLVLAKVWKYVLGADQSPLIEAENEEEQKQIEKINYFKSVFENEEFKPYYANDGKIWLVQKSTNSYDGNNIEIVAVKGNDFPMYINFPDSSSFNNPGKVNGASYILDSNNIAISILDDKWISTNFGATKGFRLAKDGLRKYKQDFEIIQSPREQLIKEFKLNINDKEYIFPIFTNSSLIKEDIEDIEVIFDESNYPVLISVKHKSLDNKFILVNMEITGNPQGKG